MKKICLTVTTDLTYDQRMIRICTSLAAAGYNTLLIGRKKRSSLPLKSQPFHQKRLFTFFEKGKFFYIEYNLRLFVYLLFHKTDLFCAIDLDTILPVLLASKCKQKPRVYDAHELFCEMKEVVTRPSIYRIWKKIEKICVPKFKCGYTVSQPIADEFKSMYDVDYGVIRNVPFLKPHDKNINKENFIICQGSVNEGRCFETIVPAMRLIEVPLVVCGDGNFMEQLKKLIAENNISNKISLKGLVAPEQLQTLTQKARIGLSLFENGGKSVYLSLANRFFDYIHAGIPQLCSDYPAYREINNLYEIAVLIKDMSPENITRQLNELLNNPELSNRLSANCENARQSLNWQEEEKKLIALYKNILS